MTKEKSTLKEGEDYYLNPNGVMVFTESFLARRGYCCQSGCNHCPYGYKQKVDPNIPVEFQDPWSSNQEQVEIYDGEIEEF